MASTKDLKKRITSVKNTQQTTKAMKMVSAAKLRRAQDTISSHRPYAQEIAKLMGVLGADARAQEAEVQRKSVSAIVVVSSDRGLCGGYNANIIRLATQTIQKCQKSGKEFQLFFVGKKAHEIVRSRLGVKADHFEEFGQKIVFKKAADLAKKMLPLWESGEFDEVLVIYNEFQNAITQIPRVETVLPVAIENQGDVSNELTLFEPSKPELYHALKNKYFTVQLYRAFLEAQASEHGSRMSAMENATQNAGDMIRRLTLQYNKQRQALITKELLEIIAGSESQKNVS